MMYRFRVPADRITVIHNGVDLNYFRPAAAPSPPERQVVLSIARLVPEKDHETLIAAFALVAPQHPQAELWLVGDGPQEKAIRRQAGRLLSPRRVRFVPGQADLLPLLRQGSLLALSSVQEGLPNVVLEAMASSLPVVATDVGGLSEVVEHGETGWLVSPKDVVGLADAMNQLLANDTMRASFGQAGRRRAERRFSMAAMVQQHQGVFLRLLDRYLGNRPSGRRY